jgi:hypothetical protein
MFDTSLAVNVLLACGIAALYFADRDGSTFKPFARDAGMGLTLEKTTPFVFGCWEAQVFTELFRPLQDTYPFLTHAGTAC